MKFVSCIRHPNGFIASLNWQEVQKCYLVNQMRPNKASSACYEDPLPILVASELYRRVGRLAGQS